MANTNLTFKKLVHKLSTPDAYQRLRSSNHDDAIPLLRREPRDPPPSYSREAPQQVYTSFRDEQAGEQQWGEQQQQQRGQKILCTADRLAVGMGLEYKKREVLLKRTSSSAGVGGGAYKRAGGGGRSGSRKK
ncbi:uncharacterized protein H6S33_010579 [Morchella sextelata]|uniref:uncharacterized protein n=1 Tax=Morchella sextelata TaxID=1174677 RepID=UPI001D052928|nr:uncharacterized protein H6S33_010579 [Morchella sextelata]KAH0611314.1 hypothetical protein H6S33_010579 [Morchella sextelata]